MFTGKGLYNSFSDGASMQQTRMLTQGWDNVAPAS